MKICSFGKISSGREAVLITLTNTNGVKVSVTSIGAALQSICVPDRNRIPVDVVLGAEDAAGYEANDGCLGACVGRVANRIAGAAFTLNGKTYPLTANNGINCLHGGRDFWDKRIWNYDADEARNAVTFTLLSPDGDQGFPGNLTMAVTYTLREDNGLSIHYYTLPDQDTIINMTNHVYLNLNGHNTGSCLDHWMTIHADFFTPLAETGAPDGRVAFVKDTPMDFNTPHRIGERIEQEDEQLQLGTGYDHNYCLKDYRGKVRPAAEVFSDTTGIHMEVLTDAPGLQFYTANFLENIRHAKDGADYRQRDAFCLETQGYPNAINVSHFPSVIVKAGTAYDTETIYRFTVR